MQYHHQEMATVKRKKVMVVISELVEGRETERISQSPAQTSTDDFRGPDVLDALAADRTDPREGRISR